MKFFSEDQPVHHFFFLPQEEWINFGRAESRTSWQEANKVQIKFATTCNKNGQQQNGRNSAEL